MEHVRWREAEKMKQIADNMFLMNLGNHDTLQEALKDASDKDQYEELYNFLSDPDTDSEQSQMYGENILEDFMIAEKESKRIKKGDAFIEKKLEIKKKNKVILNGDSTII